MNTIINTPPDINRVTLQIKQVNVAAIAKMVVAFTVGIVTMMNSVDCGSNKISRTLAICFLNSSSLADLMKQGR